MEGTALRGSFRLIALNRNGKFFTDGFSRNALSEEEAHFEIFKIKGGWVSLVCPNSQALQKCFPSSVGAGCPCLGHRAMNQLQRNSFP